VSVYRQRALAFPSPEGFDIIAKVHNPNGDMVHEARVYQLDLWKDMDDGHYAEVICTDEEILIGPGHYGGEARSGARTLSSVRLT
jgi:hypothetical protein